VVVNYQQQYTKAKLFSDQQHRAQTNLRFDPTGSPRIGLLDISSMNYTKKGIKAHAVTSKGHVLATYSSANVAGKMLKITGVRGDKIRDVCLGKRANIKGFIFRDAHDDAELNELSGEELEKAMKDATKRGEHVAVSSAATTSPYGIKASVVTSNGNVIATYSSAKKAGRMLKARYGIRGDDIRAVCNNKVAHVEGLMFRDADDDAALLELTSAQLQNALDGAIDRGEHVEIKRVKYVPKKQVNAYGIKASVISPSGKVLATYQSAKEAAVMLGIGKKGDKIRDVMNEKLESYAGFVFREAADDEELNKLTRLELQEALLDDNELHDNDLQNDLDQEADDE